MNFHFKKYVSVITGALMLAALPVSGWALDNFYGLRTVNKELTASQLEHKPIDGYTFVFSAAFVTKGAWGFDNPNNFTRLLAVMEKAQKEGELTTEGTAFYNTLLKIKPKIQANPNDAMTMSGIRAVNHLGASYAQTRKNLMLNQRFDNNINVLFAYDGSNITLKTGEQFVLGLIKSFSNDKIQIEYIQDELPDVLAYYESREFRDWLNSYPDTHRQLGQIKYGTQQKSNQTKNYVDNVLQRIFKKKMLGSINGNTLILDSRIEARDIVDAIFDTYKFMPSLSIQDAEEFNKSFADIMRNDEKRQFSAIDNANMFITVGPSVTGQIQTTEQGRRLFNDLHVTIQDYMSSNGNDEQVKLYFVDPKALLSLLTLLEGSKLGDTLGPNENYSYQDDVFKTSELTPLNTIMIWDFYKNRDNRVLVRINHNGKVLTLKDQCQPNVQGSYNLDDLTKCLAEQ